MGDPSCKKQLRWGSI